MAMPSVQINLFCKMLWNYVKLKFWQVNKKVVPQIVCKHERNEKRSKISQFKLNSLTSLN